MDVASLPALSTIPAPFIRCQYDCFYTYGKTGHMFLLGNVGIVEATMRLFDQVLAIHERGSDRMGLRPQQFGVFYIEPHKGIWLWVFDHHEHNYRVPTPPTWLKRMKPVLEAALAHAKEKPGETQVFIPDDKRGWRYGRMCND